MAKRKLRKHYDAHDWLNFAQNNCDKFREGSESDAALVKRLQAKSGLTIADFAILYYLLLLQILEVNELCIKTQSKHITLVRKHIALIEMYKGEIPEDEKAAMLVSIKLMQKPKRGRR